MNQQVDLQSEAEDLYDNNKVRIVDLNQRLKIARKYENKDNNSILIDFDGLLAAIARRNAAVMGLNYESLRIKDKLLLTRFRCPLCGLLPLYLLDLKNLNRVRCGRCSLFVTLRNSGKYGKVRKKIAIDICKEIEKDF